MCSSDLTNCAGQELTPFTVNVKQVTPVSVNVLCTLNGAGDAGAVAVTVNAETCPVWTWVTDLGPNAALSASNGGLVANVITANATMPGTDSILFTWTLMSGHPSFVDCATGVQDVPILRLCKTPMPMTAQFITFALFLEHRCFSWW